MKSKLLLSLFFLIIFSSFVLGDTLNYVNSNYPILKSPTPSGGSGGGGAGNISGQVTPNHLVYANGNNSIQDIIASYVDTSQININQTLWIKNTSDILFSIDAIKLGDDINSNFHGRPLLIKWDGSEWFFTDTSGYDGYVVKANTFTAQSMISGFYCNATQCNSIQDFLALSGNPFNQNLNTTNDVKFNSINASLNVTAQIYYGNGSKLSGVCLQNGSNCAIAPAINPFDQNLNTTNNVKFNSINYSGASDFGVLFNYAGVVQDDFKFFNYDPLTQFFNFVYANMTTANVLTNLTIGQSLNLSSSNLTIGQGVIYFGGIRMIHTSFGQNNVFFGRSSGDAVLASAIGDVGIGSFTLQSLTSGGSNLAFGNSALNRVTTGGDNVGLGTNGLYYATGSRNSAIGSNACSVMRTGNYNVCIGFNSGSGAFAGSAFDTGSNNVLIGSGAKQPANQSDFLNIGGGIYGRNLRISNGAVSENISVTFISGIKTLNPRGEWDVNGSIYADNYTGTFYSNSSGAVGITKQYELVCDVDLVGLTKKYQNFTYSGGILTGNTSCA